MLILMQIQRILKNKYLKEFQKKIKLLKVIIKYKYIVPDYIKELADLILCLKSSIISGMHEYWKQKIFCIMIVNNILSIIGYEANPDGKIQNSKYWACFIRPNTFLHPMIFLSSITLLFM